MIFNSKVPLIWKILNFHKSAGLQPSLTDLLRKHTHTLTHLSSTSERGFWSISFFHQSLSRSGSEVHICSLSYLYSRLMGKFKFGITSDCWPEPISDNWQAPRFSLSPCFREPYNKISHSLEQAHVCGISKIPVPELAIPVSYAWG